MPLRVRWEKGMRLSTEVFEASDAYTDECIRLSNIIATGGRFGLIPAHKPFDLSVNVSNNILEVISLSCHGVTKDGSLVDIEFDSKFTHVFDTRVSIPPSNGDEAFLLVVRLHEHSRREVSDLLCEQEYSFELIGENSPVGDNMLPIGLLVNQYGWRLDETDFAPPCVFIGAHQKYIDQANRAKNIIKVISNRCLSANDCVAVNLLGSIWTATADNYIEIEKGIASLSPEKLFGSIQKVVGSFIIGCSLDEYVTLENAAPFVAYVQRPLDVRNLYRDIRDGLELCTEISIKMEAVCGMTEQRERTAPPVEKPAPKPQPQPESKPKGRNRWEGIEI